MFLLPLSFFVGYVIIKTVNHRQIGGLAYDKKSNSFGYKRRCNGLFVTKATREAKKLLGLLNFTDYLPARRSTRLILPLIVLGSSSLNSTILGYL